MKNKGFTLVEVLAVVTLLGIISSISVVAVNKARENTKQRNKENIIREILTGAKKYVVDNQINNSIEVSELIKDGYVEFDESEYPDIKNKTVSIEECEYNKVRLRYLIFVDGKTYTDCGCNKQELGIENKGFCIE